MASVSELDHYPKSLESLHNFTITFYDDSSKEIVGTRLLNCDHLNKAGDSQKDIFFQRTKSKVSKSCRISTIWYRDINECNSN